MAIAMLASCAPREAPQETAPAAGTEKGEADGPPEGFIEDINGNVVRDCSTPPINDPRTWPIPEYGSRHDEGDPSAHVIGPCDPFKVYDVPLKLEHPIAVGRDKDGVMYVADRAGRDGYGFIGRDGTLERVLGGGGGSASASLLWTSFGTHDVSILLRIDRKAFHAGRVGPQHFSMGKRKLEAGDKKRSATSSFAQSMCERELLEILPPEVIEGWTIKNHRWTPLMERGVRMPDGRLLVVTRTGQGFDHIRVFFGPEDNVEERGLTTFGREKDGGTTHVKFLVDGKPAYAYFPVRCGKERGQPCPGTLTIDGDETEIPVSSLLPREASPPSGHYICGAQALRVPYRVAVKTAKEAVGGRPYKCWGELGGPTGVEWWDFECSKDRSLSTMKPNGTEVFVRVDGRTGTAQGLDGAPPRTRVDPPRPERSER